jgi:hypothetical protein
MDKNALEAPCGIHCGLCPMHLATTDEALRNRIAERMKRPPETVPCAGCRAIEGHCPVIGEQCATWVCSKEKGIEFCCECPDFPCIKLMPCSDRASTLPHNIKVYSLALRKSKGALEWEKAIKEAYDLYYKGEMVVGRGPRPKAPPASTP